MGRKTSEDDRVHRSDARTGEHRYDGLGNHRHVDHDAVAGLHAESDEDTTERRHVLQQSGVGDRLLRPRDGAVVDQRRAFAVPGDDVPVERVVAGVEGAVGEPGEERGALGVEDDLRFGEPIDEPDLLAPESGGVVDAARVLRAITHGPIQPCGDHRHHPPHPLRRRVARFLRPAVVSFSGWLRNLFPGYRKSCSQTDLRVARPLD
jgi:hypothetical protein